MAETLEERTQQEKPKKRFKWTKRALVLSAIIAAALVAGDYHLTRSYERNREEKTAAEGAARALFQNKAAARAYFSKEYLNSLGQEFWQEIENCELLEYSIHGIEQTNANTRTAHYSVIYRNKTTGETESNAGTFELAKEGGKWTVQGE
jgi:hypothetical protein